MSILPGKRASKKLNQIFLGTKHRTLHLAALNCGMKKTFAIELCHTARLFPFFIVLYFSGNEKCFAWREETVSANDFIKLLQNYNLSPPINVMKV